MALKPQSPTCSFFGGFFIYTGCMLRKHWGAALWVLSIQYFIVQVIAATAYTGNYSWAHNTISDLGNTVCGAYVQRYVCSPLHVVMNTSFITLGVTQFLGAVLLNQATPRFRWQLAGYTCMGLAGLGTILVGLYPENSVRLLHAIGAALPFVLGNVALLLLAEQPSLPQWLRRYSQVSGSVGLAALLLFITHNYLGIGQGGMERFVAYPQTFWMIVIGVYYIRGMWLAPKDSKAA